MYRGLFRCHDTVSLSLLLVFGVLIWAIAVTSPGKGAPWAAEGTPGDAVRGAVGRSVVEGTLGEKVGETLGRTAGGDQDSQNSLSASSDPGNADSSTVGGLDAPGGERVVVAKIHRSDQEWRTILSLEEFSVIREGGTEARGSSPLLREKRPGTYKCRACGSSLFASQSKYDSGTGWPSFTEALPGAVDEKLEEAALSYFGRRTEVTCSRCGAHLGHVFDDGPEPTHHRYCMNGIVLTFSPNSTISGD